MPKVLFSHDIFAIQRYGGVSRYVVQLHTSLAAAGVDSRVFGGLHINRYLDDVRGVTGRRIARPAPGPSRPLLRALNVAAEEQLLRTWKPAAYHLTYYSRRRPRLSVPVVVTVYDMIHELFPEQFAAQDRTSEHKRWWVDAADLVFVPSDQTRSDLVRFWPSCAAKAVVVRPGIMPLEPDENEMSNSYGDYLLFVGDRRSPYKNFARLVAAVAASAHGRKCQLVCFGGGEFSEGERRSLAAAGLIRGAHAASGPDSLLRTLYRHARALVYPSTYEGFGFPLLEAMSLGCPVVCSATGSIPEVVGSAALSFDPEDVDSMAGAIDRILDGSELAASLRAAGLVRAEAFDWRRAGREARPYYELLEPKGLAVGERR